MDAVYAATLEKLSYDRFSHAGDVSATILLPSAARLTFSLSEHALNEIKRIVAEEAEAALAVEVSA